MVDTRSNMQLYDLDYKPHGRKSLRNLIDRDIGAILYPPPGSLYYQLLCLGGFHGPTHINCEQKKKSKIKKIVLSSARNCTTKSRTNQIYRSLRILGIVIYTDVNIKFIKIHPCISVLIS